MYAISGTLFMITGIWIITIDRWGRTGEIQMQNFTLHSTMQFSSKEKEKSFNTAKRMVGLVRIARQVGILGLEDEVKEDSAFMRKSIDLIVNGLSPYHIENIIQSIILSNEYSETSLLDKLIIAQGVTAIMSRHSPFVVAHFTGAILGEEYIQKLIAETNGVINTNELIDNHSTYFPESINFEEKLLELTRAQLSYFLKPIAPSEHIILAETFRGCSKSFINKMKDGLSESSFNYICELFCSLLEIKEENLELIKNTTLGYQRIMLNDLEKFKETDKGCLWESLKILDNGGF